MLIQWSQRRTAGVNPIAALFASGEQGVWYDPSDLGSLFQDTEGTVPVTAAGQPVGRVKDKSGRGHDLTAMGVPGTLRADGPRMYIDGLAEGYASQTIDMSTSGQLTVCAGVRKTSDAAIAIVAELSGNLNSSTGAWYIAAPIDGGSPGLSFVAKGTNAQYLDSLGFAAPVSAVVTAQANLATPVTNMRVNGVQTANSTGDLGSGTFGAHQLYVGRRGSGGNQFSGRLYGLIVRLGGTSSAQRDTIEAYMTGKTL